jgi:hypothetical protein
METLKINVMKNKILSIASDLNQGFMNVDEAKEHLLILFGVIDSVCDCVIPKPKDAYHELDSKICRDCNGNIKQD